MTQYIKIYAQITHQTSTNFQSIVERMLQQGLTNLYLLLCTQGGSVYDGVAIYNFLKDLPIEINTHNFGSVDSIGIPIFCLGRNRTTTPYTKFSFHPVSMQISINSTLDEVSLIERLEHLKREQNNIINIISSVTNKHIKEIQELINNRTVLGSEEAQTLGLVTEIKTGVIPVRSNLTSIYDTYTTQQEQPFFTGNVPFKTFIPAPPSGQTEIINSI